MFPQIKVCLNISPEGSGAAVVASSKDAPASPSQWNLGRLYLYVLSCADFEMTVGEWEQ